MAPHVTNQHPYIGITGFMHQDEVAQVLTHAPEHHAIMIGVLSSRNKLLGKSPKSPGRYPELEAVKHIFVDHPRSVNLIHYATNDQGTLEEQLERFIDLGGKHLHGFQLNMAWPNPRQLEKIAPRLKRLVLQLGSRAIQEGGAPHSLSDRLSSYNGLITDILFDTSGGLGKPFNPAFARSYLEQIVHDHPTLGIGVAGGLAPETVSLVEPLLKDFPQLSIDAEGRLRDTLTDTLNIARSIHYLHNAAALYANP
jgi:phosphoribosylanthranilate isomerase